VLEHRRPAAPDVGVRLRDGVRVLAFQAIEERAEQVQMVEVLEHAEAERPRQVRVGLVLRHVRRHLDGHLLVGDAGLER
jgi:hypothetical protein